jgi:hypothetical protein
MEGVVLLSYYEFVDWLEEHLPNVKGKFATACRSQLHSFNSDLEKKKRLSDTQIERESDRIWKATLNDLYIRCKKSLNKAQSKRGFAGWIDYLETNEVATSFLENIESY